MLFESSANFSEFHHQKAPAQSTSKFKFDMSSKDCVIRAQQYMMQAVNKLKEARLLDPLISEDPNSERMIRTLNSILDKKIAVDLSVEIPAAQRLLCEAARLLYDEKVNAKRRIKAIHQTNVDATTTKLQQAKENLDAIRRSIVLDVIGARDLCVRPTSARPDTPGLSFSMDAISDPEDECTTPVDGTVNGNFSFHLVNSAQADLIGMSMRWIRSHTLLILLL